MPSPVERMTREETMLKERLANLDAERPSLEAFYNALSPAQKIAFHPDGMGGGMAHPMLRRMMVGMMDRMHGPMDRGPMDHGPMDHGPDHMGPPPPDGPMGPPPDGPPPGQ